MYNVVSFDRGVFRTYSIIHANFALVQGISHYESSPSILYPPCPLTLCGGARGGGLLTLIHTLTISLRGRLGQLYSDYRYVYIGDYRDVYIGDYRHNSLLLILYLPQTK